MLKNTAGQVIGAELVSASTGAAFTSAVTVYVTGDGGTQAAGSVSSGACTHEGNGYHTYNPATAETNYDQIAFTFTGTGAVPVTVQVATSVAVATSSITAIASAVSTSVSSLLSSAAATIAAIVDGVLAGLSGAISVVDVDQSPVPRSLTWVPVRANAGLVADKIHVRAADLPIRLAVDYRNDLTGTAYITELTSAAADGLAITDYGRDHSLAKFTVDGSAGTYAIDVAVTYSTAGPATARVTLVVDE